MVIFHVNAKLVQVYLKLLRIENIIKRQHSHKPK